MGKKSRRDAQKLEEETATLAAAKAAEAKAAKRAVAAAKAEAAKAEAVTVAPRAAVGVAEAEGARPASSPSPTRDGLAEQAAKVGDKHVTKPATVKPKKARFVREKVAKKTTGKDAPLPPRNTTAAGKMMSKNVTLRPDGERSSGSKDDRTTGPKPKSKPKP